MNKTIIRNRTLAVTLGAIAFTTILVLPSCVAEEYEYCPPRLLITTDHETGMYGDPAGTRARSRAWNVGDWYDDCIDSVSVYVFDENERFITLWNGGPYTPGAEYEVPLVELCLPEGTYTFVAWTNRNLDGEGNDDHQCNIEALLAAGGEIHLGDFRMSMNLPDDRMLTEDICHRHYGILERVNVSNNSILDPRQSTIVIDPSIHKVNIMLEGAAIADIDGGHTITVTDHNAVHDFHNKHIQGEPYYQTRSFEDVSGQPGGPGDWWSNYDERPGYDPGAEPLNRIVTSVNLMQIHDLSKTGFVLNDRTTTRAGGKPLFAVDDLKGLIELVYGAWNRKVDFEETLEFTITITDITQYYVNIDVNGWTYRLNIIDALGK